MKSTASSEREKAPGLGLVREWWPALAIAALSLPLLLGSLRSEFLDYDDLIHIHLNPQVMRDVPLAQLFEPRPNSTYFPLTTLSYRLDRLLFSSWMTSAFQTWAPGVRLMTWLYHSLAAILLWRLMLRLGLSRLQALFAAAAFACHPVACETVCWVSERKNALAALFGIAALLAQCKFAGRRWRLLLVGLLYLLALMGKPSALGLLGLFFVLELIGGTGGLEEGAPWPWQIGGRGRPPHPARQWLAALAWTLPLALIALAIVKLNLAGHKSTLVPPPGGSVFTAILTDFEILARYLFNLFLPIRLSFVYYVAPIVSPADPRLAVYALVLAGVVGGTLRLAANRRRAAFGWLWFIFALVPNLNLVSIPQLMQDRYIYLSVPGFFLVLVEVAAGLHARLKDARPDLLKLPAAAYIVMFVLLGLARGFVFEHMVPLFEDAAAKQPLAAHAHYGLAMAYRQAHEGAADPLKKKEFRAEGAAHARAFMDKCPDAIRDLQYSRMALEAGEYALEELKDAREAERFFLLGRAGAPGVRIDWQYAPRNARRLAELKLPSEPETAHTLADEALRDYVRFEVPTGMADRTAEFRVTRAEAALALARLRSRAAQPDAARKLEAEAKADAQAVLQTVKEDSLLYKKARELARGLN